MVTIINIIVHLDRSCCLLKQLQSYSLPIHSHFLSLCSKKYFVGFGVLRYTYIGEVMAGPTRFELAVFRSTI